MRQTLPFSETPPLSVWSPFWAAPLRDVPHLMLSPCSSQRFLSLPALLGLLGRSEWDASAAAAQRLGCQLYWSPALGPQTLWGHSACDANAAGAQRLDRKPFGAQRKRCGGSAPGPQALLGSSAWDAVASGAHPWVVSQRAQNDQNAQEHLSAPPKLNMERFTCPSRTHTHQSGC